MYNYPAGDWQFTQSCRTWDTTRSSSTHDLGHFMRKPINVAYAIACGYAMSAAWHHDDANNQTWSTGYSGSMQSKVDLQRLCRQETHRLRYSRKEPATAPHNTIYAEYDGTSIVVNIGERPLELKGLLDSTKFIGRTRGWKAPLRIGFCDVTRIERHGFSMTNKTPQSH